MPRKEQIGRFDPYSVEELKRLHGLFTKYTVDESGAFRRGEEGVFDGDRWFLWHLRRTSYRTLWTICLGWMARERFRASAYPIFCIPL